MNFDEFARMLEPESAKQEAEHAGYDCEKNGANNRNCALKYFATGEITNAWEKGKQLAKAERGE